MPDPQEVVIVRPSKTWSEALWFLVGSLAGFFIRAGLISWAAAHVEMVPDWGYVESMFVALLASWIFYHAGDYNVWSKGWSSRLGAARDLFAKDKK